MTIPAVWYQSPMEEQVNWFFCEQENNKGDYGVTFTVYIYKVI